MGRRYYCEFCDRAFLDNLNARKKHVVSSTHQQLRKAYYDKFKTKQQKLNDELAKPRICKYYQNSGNCQFGSSCRYRHISDVEIERIKKEINEESKKDEMSNRTVKNWLSLNKQKQISKEKLEKTGGAAVSERKIPDIPQTSTVLPDSLKQLPFLPLSMQPPPEDGWPRLNEVEWG
ncbi:zinc finger matrin-type protein 5-like [Styela clava]